MRVVAACQTGVSVITEYQRKISTEEASKGYIFVLKNALDFFPRRGEEFVLSWQGEEHRAMVDSYDCICRGPDYPHEHYFVRWPGLAAGTHLTVRRSEGQSRRYVLTLS
jgi:hypothetical protein